ncbi:hypothetical protein D9B36_05750 [Corynebacterium diphtheriae]|nr:hypothetical protein D9B36_05750 [Corynebacterium diphtheriae]
MPNLEKAPLIIVGLKIDNFKRIRTVDITPNPNNPIVAISGRNAQGKSSVIDAIWACLDSKSAKRATGTTKPIREGAKDATIEIDLGDLIVTRRFTAKTSTLTVTNKDGAQYKSPQAVLDDLLGRFAFDPLEFTRLTPKAQVEALLNVVDLDIDIDALDMERKRIYDERTAVGQRKKSYGALVEPDSTLPQDEISLSDLLNNIQALQNEELRYNEAKRAQEARIRDLEATKQKINELQLHAEQLDAEIVSNTAIIEAMPKGDGVEEIRGNISTLEDRNRLIRENNAVIKKNMMIEQLDEEYRSLTDRIARLDKKKQEALDSCVMPLEGLSFNEEGLTYNGIPFTQSSQAEKLRVSCALATAGNPNIRVMRVSDGSLMDSESQKILSDIAAETGFQVWVELVDETGEHGIVIEDGQVRELIEEAV